MSSRRVQISKSYFCVHVQFVRGAVIETRISIPLAVT